MDKLDYRKVFPKTPDVVINKIEEEVNKQLCGRKRRVSVKKVLIVSLAAVMLLGTTVFAAEKLIDILVEKKGYETKITVEVPSINGSENKKAQVKEEFAGFKNIAIKLGYVPEGFSAGTDNVKYYSPDKTEGISVMPGKLTNADRTVIINSSIQADEVTFADRIGYIVTKSVLGKYDKECYVFFENSSYFVMFYMTKGISKEEAIKVMENCTILGTNEESVTGAYVINKETEYMTQWYCNKELVHQVEDPDPDKDSAFAKFAGIGESISTNGRNLTLNKVEVLDSIYDVEDFDKNKIRLVDGELLDDEGRILPYNVSLVNAGDGVNTVNTIVGEKEVERKLVAVHLTVTCYGTTHDGMGYRFAPSLIFDEENAGDVGAYTKDDAIWGGQDLIYNSCCTNNESQFFYGNMKHGEAAECILVYAVDADNLSHMGLGLRFSGNESYVGKAFDIRIK